MLEIFGYLKEFYVGNKLLGYIESEKDREIPGYLGRRTETVQEEIVLHNKKKIKPGTEVLTILVPLSK